MESAVWDALRTATTSHGDVQRVENLCVPGMPDVNGCTHGVEWWVENKWLAGWPRRLGAVVLMPKIRVAQRVWWRRRGEAGGRVFVLVGVEVPKLYLLYAWRPALKLGSYTVSQMLDLACVSGGPRFPAAGVLHVLTKAGDHE